MKVKRTMDEKPCGGPGGMCRIKKRIEKKKEKETEKCKMRKWDVTLTCAENPLIEARNILVCECQVKISMRAIISSAAGKRYVG